ncbi:MAG: hypothetical protein LRY28_03920 [Erysipelotrichaceae bacterium]|nr:hypothetical protein [Erysipelotrichaceae bacterium]
MKHNTMLSIHHPQLIELNHELSLASKELCLHWVIEVLETMIVPCLVRQNFPIETSLVTINGVKQWMKKEVKLTHVKPLILKLHELARQNSDQLIIMGCLRSIAHGCSTIHSQRHAIGIAYYGALALAREQCYINPHLPLDIETLNAIQIMKRKLIITQEKWAWTQSH